MTDMSSMYYSGEVFFDIKKNGKIIRVKSHNEGLPYLKYIFSRYLVGGTSTVSPGSVDLIEYESQSDFNDHKNDDTYGTSFLIRKPEVTGKQYADSIGYYTEFKCSITSDNLVDYVNSSDTRVFYLYLLTTVDTDTNKSYRLARIQVPVSLLAKITPGIIGIITWRMRLLNGGES